MKHVKLVSRGPDAAEVPMSSLEIKVQFLVDLVDRAITYIMQKESAL